MATTYRADEGKRLERAREQNIEQIRAKHAAARRRKELNTKSLWWTAIIVLLVIGTGIIWSSFMELNLAEINRDIEGHKARIEPVH